MQNFAWQQREVQNPEGQMVEVDEADTSQPDYYDILISKFDKFFIPSVNVINEIAVFNKRVQGPNELISDFVTELQNLVKTCSYMNPERQI